MIDQFGRNITYLRISVTDRCNLRCTYCMPEERTEWLPNHEMLSYEEIVEIVNVGVAEFGIEKIRLTGGEPLVRKNISKLVQMLNDLNGIKSVALTTNGILLAQYAAELKAAGLARVNISLDTTSAKRYSEITGGGDIEKVKQGIRKAKEVGFDPIKINVVKQASSNSAEYDELRLFCKTEGLQLRFINQMNLNEGTFSQVEGGLGGNCAICNRIRLLANGEIKPCLFADKAFNIKEYGIKEAFEMALNEKPEKGDRSSSHQFFNIGG